MPDTAERTIESVAGATLETAARSGAICQACGGLRKKKPSIFPKSHQQDVLKGAEPGRGLCCGQGTCSAACCLGLTVWISATTVDTPWSWGASRHSAVASEQGWGWGTQANQWTVNPPQRFQYKCGYNRLSPTSPKEKQHLLASGSLHSRLSPACPLLVPCLSHACLHEGLNMFGRGVPAVRWPGFESRVPHLSDACSSVRCLFCASVSSPGWWRLVSALRGLLRGGFKAFK